VRKIYALVGGNVAVLTTNGNSFNNNNTIKKIKPSDTFQPKYHHNIALFY